MIDWPNTYTDAMQNRQYLLFFVLAILTGHHYAVAQDTAYAKNIMNYLGSDQCYGRGYVQKGDSIAAEYIVSQMRKWQGSPLDQLNDYRQKFTLPINTFPDTMQVSINKQQISPGVDYLIAAHSIPCSGYYKIKSYEYWLKQQDKNNQPQSVCILPLDAKRQTIDSIINPDQPQIIIRPVSDTNLIWSVANASQQSNYTLITVRSDKLPTNPETITVNIESEFFEAYKTQNILASLRGTQYPDHYIAITAHYDHLGMMGSNTMFPGGHDNASGIALMLDIMRYFSDTTNRPTYSLLFIAIAAEETGLTGSRYCASHLPVVPQNIKLLINLDMTGTGSEGIKIVNSLAHPSFFNKLKAINKEHHFIQSISPRSQAAISDHYPFSLIGVPSVYIYTLGQEYKHYHTIYDDPHKVPLTAYSGLFKLLTTFIHEQK